MKINFLLPGYRWEPSGGFKVVYEYANRLVARGHQVSVIHPRRLKLPTEEKVTIRSVARITRWRLRELLSKPVIRWHRIDPRVRLLYVPNCHPRHIPDANVLFATAWHTVRPVMQCPSGKGIKCYLIQHYETFLGPQNLVDDTWRAPLRKVVVSKWLAEIGAGLGANDISHIPIGIDHQLYRVTHPIPQRLRQVAMMFSHVSFKRSADGIRALEIAKQQFPDLRVVLFGASQRAPSVPDWMTYIADPGQEHIVETILNASSVILSASLAEGFGLPPAEGAACGCAMVSTDSGGVRDFIIPGQTGLLSAPGDPEALARNLCLLFGNDDLRIRLAEAGRQFVQRLNWDSSTDLLESFLNQTVQPERAKSNPVLVAQPPQMAVPRLEMN
jgi:glycosyltransferase involved in cell wall biosynthesis